MVPPHVMAATLSRTPPSKAAAGIITARSDSRSSRSGSVRAAIMEPPPNRPRASATSVCGRFRRPCTITTVLTMTMAPAAATARFRASNPRRRGVDR